MGLRDRIKERVKTKVATTHDAGAAAAAARDRAAQVRQHIEQVDAGEQPGHDEDVRGQAERAQQTATMTPPVHARLDPIDVPHPYEDERRRGDAGRQGRERGRDDRQPTMEDLVLGRDPGADEDDEKAGLLSFPEDDDDDEWWF